MLALRCPRSIQLLLAGVPQGGILSPLFFSIYINDVVQCADAEFNLFADDMSVYVCDKLPATLQSKLQAVVDKLSAWFNSWAIGINHKKSALMVLSTKRSVPLLDVKLDGVSLPQVSSHKHLGLVFSNRLSWSENTSYIIAKASKKIGLLRRLRSRLPHLVLRSLYLTCVRPTLEYAGSAWIGIGSQDVLCPVRTQRAAARLITGSSLKDKLPSDLLLARAGLDTLSLRRKSMLGHTIYSLTQQPP